MTLRERQSLFVMLLALLFAKASELHYEYTLGEAYRPPEMVDIYVADGRGSERSLHPLRLAIDLNLFKNGEYLSTTEDHRELGEYWESLHELCRWGGRFNDGNHYSLEYEGRA